MYEAFVYCWTDNLTNILYLGSHKGTEDDGYVCSSKYMMKEYKSRPASFTRQIIAHGSFLEMRKFEGVILDSIDAAKDPMFYNKINSQIKFCQERHTEETKRKISESQKGKPKRSKGYKHTEESKAKMSAAKTGKPDHVVRDEAYRAKMSASCKGINQGPKSEETKRKISETKRNNPYKHSDETRVKIRDRVRLANTEEYRQKLSDAGKLAWIKRKNKIKDT